MGAASKIEWTDASWNPIRARSFPYGKLAKPALGWHCVHVSEGCRNCYAETMNRRLGTGLEFKPGHSNQIELFLDETMLLAPLHWRQPRMIFVCSMTDLFADFVPDAWIDRIFAVMALCPRHIFQVLTKRPARMLKWSKVNSTGGHIFHVSQQIDPQKHGARSGTWPLPNVWAGTSCEDQATADARIPDLRATPSAVRFVSCEPMLGPIDLTRIHTQQTTGDLVVDDWSNALSGERLSDDLAGLESGHPALNWVIVGGESGHGARPMHPDWARSIRDQCAAACVPFFFKQWGEWGPIDHSEEADEAGWQGRGKWMILSKDGGLDIPDYRWPDEEIGECAIVHIGKKRAGRLLDGHEHNELPEPRA